MSSKIPQVKITYSSKAKVSELPIIKNSWTAYNELWELYDKDTIEHVESSFLMLLNRANRVIGYHALSTGGTSCTIIDAKVVLQLALLANASGIILAHNHPSGNLKPSHEDIELSKKIKDGGRLLEITLMDHIILSPEHGQYCSLADESHI